METYSYYGTFKNADTNYEIDYAQMTAKRIANSNDNYWLASRRGATSDSYSSKFYVYYMNTSGTPSSTYLCNVFEHGTTTGSGTSLGFRPVFTLKAGIEITEENGEYILVEP